MLFLFLFSISAPIGVLSLCSIPLTSRLPESIIPLEYSVHFHPKIDQGAYVGQVTIILNITDATNCIPLHSKNLAVSRATLTKDGVVQSLVGFYTVKALEYVVVETQEDLEPAIYFLNLKFLGLPKNNHQIGFYHIRYRHPNETFDRYVMTTKFMPSAVRRAFPCFDEPQLKASFRISIVKPADETFVAISNTEQVGEHPGPNPDEVTVEFAETPQISTHHFSAVVSDMRSIEPINAGKKIQIRMFAASHLTERVWYAQKLAVEIMGFLIKYLAISYPFQKIDFVAIPGLIPFSSGNWGLITIRETRMVTSSEIYESSAVLGRIAHEIAFSLSQLWFGNLVTPKWWNDLWLSVGISKFIEYKSVASITSGEPVTGDPQWGLDDLPTLSDLKINVMAKDDVLHTTSLISSVYDSQDITDTFSAIASDKGAALLLMVEDYIGKDVFKSGLQNYLTAHQFKNADSENFWDAMDKAASSASRLPLLDHMVSWTSQMGYPMINVTVNNDEITFTQQRFINDIAVSWSPESSPYRFHWDIPICYQFAGETSPTVVVFTRDASSAVDLIKSVPINFAWLKLNCRGKGYYRVNYDTRSWNKLIDALLKDHTVFHEEDRANLLDDAFSLANAGFISFDIPLQMVEYLVHDRSRLPLSVGLSHLHKISRRLGISVFSKFVRKIARNLYSSVIKQVALDFTEDKFTQEHEFYVLQASCAIGLKQCREPLGKYFRLWMHSNAKIVPNLKPLVLGLGMKYFGTSDDWEVVLKRYLQESDVHEKDCLLHALLSTQNETLLLRFLEGSFNGTLTGELDFFGVFIKVGTAIPMAAFQWYLNNYETIVAKFTEEKKGLGTALEAICQGLQTYNNLQQLEEFYKKYPDSGATTLSRKRAHDTIQSNINWLSRSATSTYFKN